MKKIAIVDGSGFIFRAYHSLPPLTTKNGVQVNAVYGFTKAIMALKERKDINYLLVVFDSARKTFRHSIYADYKAHRAPTPEDLIPQFAIIKQIPQALNVASIEITNFEADDIIATYTQKAIEEGMEVEIVSSDKDFMQLVNDAKNVYMFDPLKKIIINESKVVEKFGVTASSVIDVQALMGDSADNVPGVKGVGPKTAAELINKFGSLENLYNNINLVEKENLKNKLIECKDLAFVSKQLVTLKHDINLNAEMDINLLLNADNTDIKNFNIKEYDFATLYNFLHNLSFNSLLASVAAKHQHELSNFIALQNTPNNNPNNDHNNDPKIHNHAIKPAITSVDKDLSSINITSVAELTQAITNFIASRINHRQISILLLENKEHYTINIGNSQHKISFTIAITASLINTEITLEDLLKQISLLLQQSSITIIFYNLQKLVFILAKACGYKQVLSVFKHLSNFEDLYLMKYLLSGTQDSKLTLDEYLVTILSEYGLYKPEFHTNAIINLFNIYKKLLVETSNYMLYGNIDKPLLKTLIIVHCNGIITDTKVLHSLSVEFTKTLQTLQDNIFKHTNASFNMASPKQLGDTIFGKFGIKGSKNKTGSWKTDSSTLEEILADEELADDKRTVLQNVLDWRKIFKLKTTYTDSLPKEISGETNRIHTLLLCCNTTTSRLSSQYPNLQNIPIKSTEGKQIRSAFIAPEGGKIISLDYSQIELRLLAHIAKVSVLTNAFKHKLDVHTQTAAEVFGVTIENVTPELRRSAKGINFGIMYGQTAFGLSVALGISQKKAKEYRDSYLKKYYEISTYMQTAINEAKENGFVTTILNRRCFISNINSSNAVLKNLAQRSAINAKIQGSAADIVRIAMNNVNDYLQQNNIKAKLLLQIHDELLIESLEHNHEALAEKLKIIMENVLDNFYSISTPLTVDYHIGNSWLE